MKKPHLIWLFILVFISLVKTNAETVIEETAGRGMIIKTNPSGASVYVDGMERGKTPLELLEIPAGTHSILLTKNNYEDWHSTISFSQESQMCLSIDLIFIKGYVDISLIDAVSGAPIYAHDAVVTVNMALQTAAVNDDVLTLRLSEGQKLITIHIFGYEEAKKNVLIEKDRIASVQFALKPAELRLEKIYLNREVFNPNNQGNLGIITLNFSVTAPGFGKFSVFDKDDMLIYEHIIGVENNQYPLEPFNRWIQAVSWNGKDKNGAVVAEGSYFLRIEVNKERFTGAEDKIISEQRQVRVDYSAEIIPLTMLCLRPGLTNAEFPRILPKGSFQISSILLAGAFNTRTKPFSQLPFAMGIRFSPLNTVEMSASVHISPLLNDNRKNFIDGTGIYLKKEAIHTHGAVPGISFGLSYSWVNAKSKSDAGLPAGAGINSALNWKLPRGFFLLFSPALLWNGENGFPQEAAPKIISGAGILWKYGFWTAGISAQSFGVFDESSRQMQRVTAEIFCYPPPSNFAMGLSVNCSIEERTAFFSGGLTLNILF
jgi:hypothetical protein